MSCSVIKRQRTGVLEKRHTSLNNLAKIHILKCRKFTASLTFQHNFITPIFKKGVTIVLIMCSSFCPAKIEKRVQNSPFCGMLLLNIMCLWPSPTPMPSGMWSHPAVWPPLTANNRQTTELYWQQMDHVQPPSVPCQRYISISMCTCNFMSCTKKNKNAYTKNNRF